MRSSSKSTTLTAERAASMIKSAAARAKAACLFAFDDGADGWMAAPGYGEYCFIADTWYAMSGAPYLYTLKQIEDITTKIYVGGDGGTWNFPAAINLHLGELWYSGADQAHNHPLGDGNMMLPMLVHLHWRLGGGISNFVLKQASLKKSIAAVITNEANGLVTIPPAAEWIPWGFHDSCRVTGDDMMGSCLLWRACICMSEMYAEVGDSANSGFFASKAATIKTSIQNVLWNQQSGMFHAATLQNNQICICGSSYAMYLGIATTDQALSISRWLVSRYNELSQEGFVRQCPDDWEYSYYIGGGPLPKVGDNGYWSVHHRWIAEAMKLTSPSAAVKMAIDYAKSSDMTQEYFDKGLSTGGFTLNISSPAAFCGFIMDNPALFAP